MTAEVWQARATTAEAALTASQERERVMREALEEAAKRLRAAGYDEGGKIFLMIDAAIQPQEPANG